MACSVCGNPYHNIKTCVYEAKRTRVAPHIKKSKRCECCGQYGYKIERHHTRGRGDDSDFLDVCSWCHLNCCHNGNFKYFAIKPRVCRWDGKVSFWRK